MATSKFIKYFQRGTSPLLGVSVFLVPQANTYPTGALSLSADETRLGYYYRVGVPDGEYKIYIDYNDGNGAVLYDSLFWIGENRLTLLANGEASIYTPEAWAAALLALQNKTLKLSNTGDIAFNISADNHKITLLTDATDPQDAVNLRVAQSLLNSVSGAFKGVAAPTTVPTPIGIEFWLASINGVYTNFGGIEIEDEIAVLYYTGLAWVKQVYVTSDQLTDLVGTTNSGSPLTGSFTDSTVDILAGQDIPVVTNFTTAPKIISVFDPSRANLDITSSLSISYSYDTDHYVIVIYSDTAISNVIVNALTW